MSQRFNPRAQGGGTPPSRATISKPTVTNGAAVVLLGLNAARKGATIWNDGPVDLLISLGGTASATDYSLKIPGGASGSLYTLPSGYTGSVSGILAAAGSQTVRVTEFT